MYEDSTRPGYGQRSPILLPAVNVQDAVPAPPCKAACSLVFFSPNAVQNATVLSGPRKYSHIFCQIRTIAKLVMHVLLVSFPK